jgi:hypothetical protein
LSAQVWIPCVEICVTPLGSAGTSTGTSLCSNVPSPSSPKPFSPQQLTPPTVVSAHV